MKNHVASVHEDNKPFKCEASDYCCSQKNKLNQHVGCVHEGNKPFLKTNIVDPSVHTSRNNSHGLNLGSNPKKRDLSCPRRILNRILNVYLDTF